MMATTCEPIDSVADVMNPNVVKIVHDKDHFALYFSGNPIVRICVQQCNRTAPSKMLCTPARAVEIFFKHTGLYVYRRKFYSRSRKWLQFLQQSESLEQLRVFENGFGLR